jgi:prevent-host-death family protein
MANTTIPTESLRFTEARPQLSELLNRVYRREARIVVKKGNIPVAAIVSIDDLERLNRFDAEWEADFAIFEEVGKLFADQSDEEIEREVAKAVAEVRAEMRAEALAAREVAMPS